MNSNYLQQIDYILKNPEVDETSMEMGEESKPKKERKKTQKEIFYIKDDLKSKIKNGRKKK